MRKLLALVAVVGLVSVSACKKDEKKAETAPTETVSPDVKPDETKPEVKPDEAKPAEMTNKMAHCPSSVEGATTVVSAGEGTIIVTVTAADEAATSEIRKRSMHLASLNDADSSEIKHSGNGTGGGALGKCPVALGQGEVLAADAEGGSTITMKPKTPNGLAELNAMVRDRAAAMAASAGHEHGAGHGANEHKGDGTGGGGGGGGGGNEPAATKTKAPKAKAGIDAGA
tara:strand:+ start:6640 stop:7323 length:684 start_codon:yes stop_codon:yes gene_type:complete